MPNIETVVAAQDRFSVRHIGPKAAIWPDAPGSVQEFTLLGCATMVARPLPCSDVPGSPDLISGTWTGRLGDAGEIQLTFPNVAASDGVPWRTRFSPDLHLQFLEVYFNGFLDVVGVIDQVTCSQQNMTVHAYDPFWLLKKAYVRDWTFTGSPRDVIERSTQLWVALAADDFPYNGGALNSQWTVLEEAPAGSITLSPSGGLVFAADGSANSDAIYAGGQTLSATGAWRASCLLQSNEINEAQFFLLVQEAGTTPFGGYNDYAITFSQPSVSFGQYQGIVAGSVPIPPAPTYALMIESDGEWIAGYINGVLIGQMRRMVPTTTTLLIELSMSSASAMQVTVANAV
ncbi:MAG: hypothetical protein ACRDNS_02435, partial [Trebonia sp.]